MHFGHFGLHCNARYQKESKPWNMLKKAAGLTLFFAFLNPLPDCSMCRTARPSCVPFPDLVADEHALDRSIAYVTPIVHTKSPPKTSKSGSLQAGATELANRFPRCLGVDQEGAICLRPSQTAFGFARCVCVCV